MLLDSIGMLIITTTTSCLNLILVRPHQIKYLFLIIIYFFETKWVIQLYYLFWFVLTVSFLHFYVITLKTKNICSILKTFNICTHIHICSFQGCSKANFQKGLRKPFLFLPLKVQKYVCRLFLISLVINKFLFGVT